MAAEDDDPRPKPRFTPLPLHPLGIEELHAYIGTLRDEIARVEAEIARKQSHTAEASRFFNF